MSETKTKRVKLVVAYDGSDFCGWAPQSGHRTVHGTLTEAVRQVSGEDNEITGASRTDSGAHAKGQVCHFDTKRPIMPSKWVRAVNDLLPIDVRVTNAQWVNRDFHSRFWAIDRWYRYRIQTGTIDPHRTRFTFPYGRPLNVGLMDSVAQNLVGTHDFFAFTQLTEPETNTEREVFKIGVKQVRDEVWIDVVATAYVRGMMRRISGALFEVGRGMRDPKTIPQLLAQRERNKMHWPIVLPASGLTLMRVRHGKDSRAPIED